VSSTEVRSDKDTQEPAAKRRRASVLRKKRSRATSSPALATTIDAAPVVVGESFFETPSFQQVMRDYTNKNVSSFTAVQSMLLLMPPTLIEVSKCPKGWDPQAPVPFDGLPTATKSSSWCSAYEAAKNLIIESKVGLPAGEAAAIVMMTYPSYFCLSPVDEEQDECTDQDLSSSFSFAQNQHQHPRMIGGAPPGATQRHTDLLGLCVHQHGNENLYDEDPLLTSTLPDGGAMTNVLPPLFQMGESAENFFDIVAEDFSDISCDEEQQDWLFDETVTITEL